ncbi:1,6-dihydroxycyclohexa-2,4-diene-1-carboxylate dehydrogenase [Klebsiella pneumoniae]|uniref:1,6-dihydroxycyclohexa-2,4-diene-1-carboxylate dehydrogenase n=1 Tax=Klebsiella pneumoniae TaxID=573 RepID=A0A377U203_KLEPN|nr:1,6-dihydroxycyclohexa-2,4-diene-1-carboxylate dehydrogenase [Klebsiella pneumoniae]
MGIALISGASRGIGRATALLLAQEGYTVAVNYHHNINAATEVVNTIVASGGKATALRADISDEAQVMAMFEAIDRMGEPLTALVNNAGILFTQCTVESLSAERINRVLATNVTGYFLCCREAVKRMSHRHGGKGGAIVNVSSAASRLGAPGEYVDYAAVERGGRYPDYRAGAGGGGAGDPGQRRASGADLYRDARLRR